MTSLVTSSMKAFTRFPSIISLRLIEAQTGAITYYKLHKDMQLTLF
ncbi:hypothetical protein [Nitrosomonas ureae]|nr:hypothetical protein [Nitrosomonas ureae]